jgi:hypothetical protein
MRVRPRLVLASLVLLATACGLAYDVDSLSADYQDCGTAGKKCCAGDTCGDNLACVSANVVSDAGPDASDAAASDAGACKCKDASADGTDAQGSGSCACASEPNVCTHCGDPAEPCCAGPQPCNGGILKCVDAGGGVKRCGGCGEKAGDQCCDGLTKCSEGLSCVNGSCSSSKPCGSAGQDCCPGDPGCNSPLVCSAGKCATPASCGELNEQCCTAGAEQCNQDSLACDGGTCVPCGAIDGQPCCQLGPPCTGVQMGCFTAENRCHLCGGAGLACCPGVPDPCPNGNGAALVCNPSGQCEFCGGIGQRCCASSGAGTPCPDQILTCVSDSCITCCARCSKNGVNAAAKCVKAGAGDCSGAAVSYCQSLGQNYKNHFWTTNCGNCPF